jgi:hypothetical protein
MTVCVRTPDAILFCQHHCLDERETLGFTPVQIEFSMFAGRPVEKLPGDVPEPIKGRPIVVDQKATVRTDSEFLHDEKLNVSHGGHVYVSEASSLCPPLAPTNPRRFANQLYNPYFTTAYVPPFYCTLRAIVFLG